MEYLAPSHHFILHLIEDFRSGKTLRTSIQTFLNEERSDFAGILLKWQLLWENGELSRTSELLRQEKTTIYQRSLFDLLALYVQGVSILEPLEALESEMRQEAHHQLEKFLSQLPFKLMIPLLFFQFPALLLLMLGPLLLRLINEVNS